MHRSPYLESLTPAKLQELIDDLRLIEAGYHLHVAIDPHEIFDFCFPINPEKYQSRDLDAIADDQAALYEVFYASAFRPILLDVYIKEVRGIMLYFQHALDDAYSDTETLNKLINEVGLKDSIKQSDVLKIVEEKFSVVLAVAMGIYSLGVERFKEVCHGIFFDGGLVSDNLFLSQTLEDYAQSVSFMAVFQELLSSHSTPSANESETERRRRNSFTDALAIDQILYLNATLCERDIDTNQPQLMLYLSGAGRTERAFQLDAIKDRLPLVNGRRFSPHRDRAQVLAYVVHKSKDNDITKSIENLEKVKALMEELGKLGRATASQEEYCSACVLEGGTPTDCPLKETCLDMTQMYGPIQERRREIRNLGLTKVLDDYQHLLDAPTKTKPQQRFMEFFRLVNGEEIRDLAKERLLEKQQLLFMQTMTTAMWPKSRQFAQSHLREGRDTIVGMVQYLPLRPKVANPIYSEILELILNYYKTPPRGGHKKLGIIDEAYRLYFQIDAKTKNLDPEHELVRCFIYMAFPSLEGDRRALEHATQMTSLTGLLGTVPYVAREYEYLRCWAARRIKKFPEAETIASAAVEQWPMDARFYHGRALNRLAWWEAKQADPTLLETAIRDVQDAIRLYGEEPEGNRELIAVNHNNLAYLYTLWVSEGARAPVDARRLLTSAREALVQLKVLLPRADWKPNHPEYFHTEALLDYNEFLFGRNDYTREELVAKLENAREQILIAISLNKITLYTSLLHTIDNALTLVK